MKVAMKKVKDMPAAVVSEELTAEGEYRISCGGSIKVTKKIGDNFIGIEVSNYRSLPVDPKKVETERNKLRQSVNIDLLEDLNTQIANVTTALKLDD